VRSLAGPALRRSRAARLATLRPGARAVPALVHAHAHDEPTRRRDRSRVLNLLADVRRAERLRVGRNPKRPDDECGES
jgi:hypothetical protein